MALPAYLIARPGDSCRCGRIASRRHCPACGSFKVRFRPGLSKQQPSGHIEASDIWFRCDACGQPFQEVDRDKCEAPEYYTTRTQRALVELLQTQNEVANGHPLTKREESLSQTIQDIGISQIVNLPLSESDHTQRFRIEWAKSRLSNHPTTESVDEFIERRIKETQEQNME